MARPVLRLYRARSTSPQRCHAPSPRTGQRSRWAHPRPSRKAVAAASESRFRGCAAARARRGSRPGCLGDSPARLRQFSDLNVSVGGSTLRVVNQSQEFTFNPQGLWRQTSRPHEAQLEQPVRCTAVPSRTRPPSARAVLRCGHAGVRRHRQRREQHRAPASGALLVAVGTQPTTRRCARLSTAPPTASWRSSAFPSSTRRAARAAPRPCPAERVRRIAARSSSRSCGCCATAARPAFTA